MSQRQSNKLKTFAVMRMYFLFNMKASVFERYRVPLPELPLEYLDVIHLRFLGRFDFTTCHRQILNICTLHFNIKLLLTFEQYYCNIFINVMMCHSGNFVLLVLTFDTFSTFCNFCTAIVII